MSAATTTTTVKHLGSIPVDSIRKIRPMDRKTLLCDEMTGRGEIERFWAKHRNLMMSWSSEGQHWFNADYHTVYSSVIVKVEA